MCDEVMKSVVAGFDDVAACRGRPTLYSVSERRSEVATRGAKSEMEFVPQFVRDLSATVRINRQCPLALNRDTYLTARRRPFTI